MAFLDELRRITRPYEDGEDDIENGAEDIAPKAEEPAEAPAEQSAPARSVFPKREREPKAAEKKPAACQKPVLAKPDSYDDSADIVTLLREKRTVLVNIENVDRDTARRIMDFLSGATYALSGNLQRFSEKAYIISFTDIDQIGGTGEVLENSGVYF